MPRTQSIEVLQVDDKAMEAIKEKIQSCQHCWNAIFVRRDPSKTSNLCHVEHIDLEGNFVNAYDYDSSKQQQVMRAIEHIEELQAIFPGLKRLSKEQVDGLLSAESALKGGGALIKRSALKNPAPMTSSIDVLSKKENDLYTHIYRMISTSTVRHPYSDYISRGDLRSIPVVVFSHFSLS